MSDAASKEKSATEWVAYRPDVKVLDCTIRDGGLVTNHQFDDAFVRKIYDTVADAGVDYVELGYKGAHRLFSSGDYGDWKFCDEDALKRVVGDDPRDIKIAVMADAERVDYKTDIVPRDQSVVDCIRVACYVHQIPLAMDMINDATDKGYETMLQLMAASVAPMEELKAALDIGATSPASTIYLVDSFGALYSEQIRELTKLYLDAVEGTGKEIGFHGHNNMQLAYANTIEALIAGCSRLDATMMGLGRGAGNCHLELILGFLHNPKFKVRPVLSTCQSHILPLRENYDWGYSIPYAITGLLNEHPRTAIKHRAGSTPDDYLAFYDEMVTNSTPPEKGW